MISERLKIASQFAIGDYIPYLRFIDYLFRYNAKAQEIQSMTMRVCDEIMNLEERRRRLTREENGDAQAVREEDFVDDLLSIQAEYAADNSRKIKLTDHQIKLLVQVRKVSTPVYYVRRCVPLTLYSFQLVSRHAIGHSYLHHATKPEPQHISASRTKSRNISQDMNEPEKS